MRQHMRVAIIGGFSGTNVALSFARAAERLGLTVLRIDTSEAWQASRLVRAIHWRLLDRRPPKLAEFSVRIIEACRQFRPEILVATGNGALTRESLQMLRSLGIRSLNYSTDDPWNPAHRANWHLRALPAYDTVFTTRLANIENFRNIGCRDVRYLPFAYDENLVGSPAGASQAPRHDVLFVGNADRDRFGFMKEFMANGMRPALVGDYWARYAAMREYSLGLKTPQELSALTIGAKINLCLVRRANRDGHVMRSFEIAAIGGCMLAEDTPEHREIFGRDDECVAYFRTAADAAYKARALLNDPERRQRLAGAAQRRILDGRHTYTDRFKSMLSAVAENSGAVCTG